MSPQEFCYWLQGFFELGDPEELTPKQVGLLEKHLDMVDVTINGSFNETVPNPSKVESKNGKDLNLRC